MYTKDQRSDYHLNTFMDMMRAVRSIYAHSIWMRLTVLQRGITCLSHWNCDLFSWPLKVRNHHSTMLYRSWVFQWNRPPMSVFCARLIMWLLVSSLQCGVHKAWQMCMGGGVWNSLTTKQSSHSAEPVSVHGTSLLIPSVEERKGLIVF